MVEHAVQHDAHAAPVRLGAQLFHTLVAAEEFIRAHIVRRVVAVVAGREKDGREIKRGDAKLREIIKPRDDALRVAAEEVVRAVVLPLLRDVGKVVPVRVQSALFAEIRRPFTRETVGEDLIHDAAFRPIRGFIRSFRHGKLPFRQPFAAHGAAAPTSAVIRRPAPGHALEAVVPQPRDGGGHAPLVHNVVPFETREPKIGAELLRPPAQDDGDLVRALRRGQREPERDRLSRDRRAVGRLVFQRIVMHISSFRASGSVMPGGYAAPVRPSCRGRRPRIYARIRYAPHCCGA